MLFNKIRVKEAMGRAGINEGLDRGSGGGVGGNEKGEGVGEKSGRVELDLISRTGGSNTALSPYGGRRTAYYFFESVAFTSDLSSVALAPRADRSFISYLHTIQNLTKLYWASDVYGVYSVKRLSTYMWTHSTYGSTII
jgi:hypothetical protein